MSVRETARLEYVHIAEAHLDDVMAIELEAYPEPWTIGMFRQEMWSPLSHFDCAFLDGVLVGYAGFWLVLDEAHITSVTVRQDCRRQGLGRQLLTHLLDAAHGLDVRRATLEVRVSNVAAQRLYEGFGFEVIGRRKGYYAKTQEDALVMLKELGPPPSAADLYGED